MISYDFNHEIFKNKRYVRIANEHIAISKLKSNRIQVSITETATDLEIPIKYEIDYLVNSIKGIKKDKSPDYKGKHTVEISFPAKFPLESFEVKAVTDIWHPNIIYHGENKGKICGNTKAMGIAYNLYQLVIRVGEIIQYKNYLAEHIDPYPYDPIVAKWVLWVLEDEDNPKHQIKFPTDNSNLLEYTPEPEDKEKKKETPNIVIDPPKNNTPPVKGQSKITIKSINKKEKNNGIVIKNVNKKRNSRR